MQLLPSRDQLSIADVAVQAPVAGLYTWPMPPAPRGPSMEQRPRLVPEMNGGSRSPERLGSKRPGRDITSCQKDFDLAVEVVISLATLFQEPEAFLRNRARGLRGRDLRFLRATRVPCTPCPPICAVYQMRRTWGVVKRSRRQRRALQYATAPRTLLTRPKGVNDSPATEPAVV